MMSIKSPLDFHKQLEAILESVAQWGYDMGVESSDGFNSTDWDNKKLHKNEIAQVTAQVTALIQTLVIGEDEKYIDIQEVNNIGEVVKTHFGETYTLFMVARNQLRAKQRAAIKGKTK